MGLSERGRYAFRCNLGTLVPTLGPLSPSLRSLAEPKKSILLCDHGDASVGDIITLCCTFDDDDLQYLLFISIASQVYQYRII